MLALATLFATAAALPAAGGGQDQAGRAVHAVPVDLRDPTPRRIAVAFEVSPHDAPGRLDATYTPQLPGWLSPTAEPGEVEIRVAGEWIERYVLLRPEAVPGSVSDFVWRFDAESGDVLSASVSGEVRTQLRFGWVRGSARAHFETDMDTLTESMGYRAPRSFLGEQLFRSCLPERVERCTPIRSHRYDPTSGYVNAVGELAVKTSVGLELRTFSPLGEAQFSEASVSAGYATPDGD